MDLYQILGVPKDASQEEIKKAYRKMAKIKHPDHGGNENEFKQLVVAYSILGDEKKRQKYDNGESVENLSKVSQEEHKTLKILIEIFVSIVDQIPNIDNVDLFLGVKKHIQQAQQVIRQRIHQENAKINKYERVKGKIKTKAANNVFAQALDANIGNCKRTISGLEDDFKTGDEALKFLEDFSYDFQEIVEIRVGGGITFTSTTGGF